MATHSYSFGDHLRALELFLKAKQDVRLLVEQGIEAAKAFDLVVLAYSYNPLMLRFYAPALHAWANRPLPEPPPSSAIQPEDIPDLLSQVPSIEEELATYDLALLNEVEQEILATLPASS